LQCECCAPPACLQLLEPKRLELSEMFEDEDEYDAILEEQARALKE
jgi:hypothetical protein